MPLLIVFIVTFTVVYIIQQRKGAILLDRLHRATLFAFGVSFLVVAASILFW